ncbi:MAG TPA: pyruvate, water dikinase regulatory protein [Rhizomicrobium sp.]|nr:pyruvate, water dikinase regulatory protein [Rhizomicrobium sp.]
MGQKFHIHLVSDATGETLNAIANAALAQFEGADVQIHSYALVRSEHQLQRSVDHIAISPGLVFFTLVNPRLREMLLIRCGSLNIACVDVMERPVTELSKFLGIAETHRPGGQHEVDQRYLARIEALNFTIQHDDGQSLDTIRDAEVILVGASRTSKTPTCVYLAIRGIRAANIPLVPGMGVPSVLSQANSPLIVGLWVSPDRLVQVRRNRLSSMGEQRGTNYIDLDSVRAEIAATRKLFEQQDWPSIDVSRRSIEETAASVMNLLTERREKAS